MTEDSRLRLRLLTSQELRRENPPCQGGPEISKMLINENKYPVEKAKGSARKYTET
jgi:hypothetical protein